MSHKDELRRRIQRYRFLEDATTDPEMRRILAQLIAEVEVELRIAAAAMPERSA